MAERKFEVVTDDPATPDPAPSRAPLDLSLLTVAFQKLSQRAIVAIADYLWAVAVFSAFWLWHSTPEPNILQLIGLGMYGVFVLAACVIVRR